jgi:hypothetical protein
MTGRGVKTMQRLAMLAIALMAPVAMAAPLLPLTVNFDDIDASVDVAVPDDYQGFTWTELVAYTETPGFPGYNNGVVSPSNAAFGGFSGVLDGVPGVSAVISAPAAFDFVSAWFGAAHYDGLTIRVIGYRDLGPPLEALIQVNASDPATFVEFDFQSVNALEFISSAAGLVGDPFGCGEVNCTQFTVDDLSFAPPTTPVPLPAAALLFGGGLLALGGVSSRRRHRSPVE